MNFKDLLLNRSMLLLSVIVGTLLLILLWIWVHFVGNYFEYSKDIVRLQPVMSRLVGIEVSEEKLEYSNRVLAVNLKRLVLPDLGDANAAAAELQKKVRGALTRNGMSVVGSQILAPQEADAYQQISLSMNLTGAMSSLEPALESLARLQPRVVVTSAQFSPARARKGEQKISMRITLVALRWKS